ncbi:hypothetical protein LOTGIDRAFT_160956 [Lottia gigantea]|uniref:SPRY domain-containing protein n=1 Tax=Lottia gigantea TaxID=225164 RepID=V3ZTE2_LOTGI|nr:hypothetical protein LOTGIDRAFT_160956 [Lottia gigantea]ESO94723.1 hypothetical protein LOTGIDRAFT_160956 [Lottia gigantea]
MKLYRCAGDIVFDDTQPYPGQTSSVILKNLSETCNFLQYLKPLSPRHPHFCAQIRSLASNSKITLGIAGPDISEGSHPGNWNNTVGYHSDSGRCYTSHSEIANTTGEKFGIGDIFGVQITYFGLTKCTVVFSKNGRPVATRYLFESNQKTLLPTISLENGPIDLGITWPDAVVDGPVFQMSNMEHWIPSSDVRYDSIENSFKMEQYDTEVTIQSPLPLSLDICHFEVVIKEVSDEGTVPSIALSSCSPIKPAPTSSLLRDFLRWNSSGVLQKNDRLGWGINYLPMEKEKKDFDPLAEQLVLCYITVNTTVAHKQIFLQPEGGFYPLVILKDTDVPLSMFRMSQDMDLTISKQMCRLRLPQDSMGIHAVQFLKPLTEIQNSFFIEVQSLNEDSFVGIGVAGLDFPDKKQPGKVKKSVGWLSRDGKLYFNGRSESYISGERYMAGDTVQVRLEYFGETSVISFSKNNHMIGCRYLNQPDHSQLLPTITLCGNGYQVVIDVCWQNQNTATPKAPIDNVESWCLPPGSHVDNKSDKIFVKDHSSPVAIQAPIGLNKDFNHFEVIIPHTPQPSKSSPIIGLTTPSPFDPPSISNFKQDLIRYSGATNDGASIKHGDRIGWGILYLDKSVKSFDEQLVIVYLTINRDVQLARVIYQPAGGFYPLILLPPSVNCIQLDFCATIIKDHPFTDDMLELLISEALDLLEKEDVLIARGEDIEPMNLFRSLHDLETERKSPQHFRKRETKGIEDHNSAKLKSQERKSLSKKVTGERQPKKGKHKRDTFVKGDELHSKSCTIL